MANPNGDIKPGGWLQRDIVNLLAMLTYSLEGLCQKLDSDAGVPLETYEANCYTAIINTIIEDCVGNRRGQLRAEHLFYEMSPGGFTHQALLEWMYNYANAIETLTEQLDADVLTDNDYEENVFTEYFTAIITNQDGNSVGNGSSFYIGPGGIDINVFVDGFYNAVKAWQVLCAQLDDDGTVTDTNYEALWYTATILLRVEDTKGNVIGNDRTDINNV